jgi:hypothetical protein
MKQDKDSPFTGTIEPYMLEPLVEPGRSGYVPLCAALHWIMTNSGTRSVGLDHDAAWESSVHELRQLICEGEVELVGLPRGQTMSQRLPQGAALAVVKMLPPIPVADGPNAIADFLVNSPSHILCCAFIDKAHWYHGFNDQLFEKGRVPPSWTHLQVRKDHVLSRWPKRGSGVQPERKCQRWLEAQMQRSPHSSPKPRKDFLAEATKMFPSLAGRQFDRAWGNAIVETGANWSRPGKRKKSARQSPTSEI